MNFSFLPDKVKQRLKAALAERIPAIIVRASGDLEGRPGEGYVVADGSDLLLFSRKLGEQEFGEIRAALNRINDFRIDQEGGQSVLALAVGGKEYRIKASNFEIKGLEPMVKRWRELTGRDPVAAAPATAASVPPGADAPVAAADAPLTPLVGMLALLMHVATADGEIAVAEDRYIRDICQDDQGALQAALAVFRGRAFADLLAELKPLLNHEQRLCVLANLMEIGMSDGSLRSSEQQLMRDFTSAMELSDDELDTIRQVLIIKNRLSVLSPPRAPRRGKG